VAVRRSAKDRFSRPDDAKEKTRSRRLAKSAQWIVFGCAAYYAIVIAVLHLLEPDYDPRYRFLSEYQWSEHGWLMYSTFFILALAMLTLALTLRTLLLPRSSVCLGVGLLIIGAAGIGLPCILMATFIFAWSFRRSSDWSAFVWPSLLIAVAMLMVFVPFAAGIWLPGLQQRLFIAMFLLWMVIIAHRSARIRA